MSDTCIYDRDTQCFYDCPKCNRKPEREDNEGYDPDYLYDTMREEAIFNES